MNELDLLTNKIKELLMNNKYLSSYEKRKLIYNYLYKILSFDFEELKNNSKDINKQLKDVLILGKGVCNSISYVYKLMLEEAGIYSAVLFCKDEEDDHTILLVANDDDTFSFDDLSIALYFKEKNQVEKYKRFDYDLFDAISMNQGVNNIRDDSKYILFPSSGVNYFFLKNNDKTNSIKPSFFNETDSMTSIISNIKSVKKDSFNQKEVKKL
ncbi:MAG: transglutaminase domain-containing protein [Tenericutes bacterium]|nr:transglutaminase domain-containing protein [Mycoplasmatota bacterium]